MSEAETLFEIHLRELGITFWREYRFHPERKWRFDFFLGKQVAIEIEGGIWVTGRHNRGKGFQDDMRKYNSGTMMGFKILRFSTGQVLSGEAKDFVRDFVLEHVNVA